MLPFIAENYGGQDQAGRIIQAMLYGLDGDPKILIEDLKLKNTEGMY